VHRPTVGLLCSRNLLNPSTVQKNVCSYQPEVTALNLWPEHNNDLFVCVLLLVNGSRRSQPFVKFTAPPPREYEPIDRRLSKPQPVTRQFPSHNYLKNVLMGFEHISFYPISVQNFRKWPMRVLCCVELCVWLSSVKWVASHTLPAQLSLLNSHSLFLYFHFPPFCFYFLDKYFLSLLFFLGSIVNYPCQIRIWNQFSR
jgi:hypothetical protein